MSARPIGIVIPTYNRQAALLECLSCLEKQTFEDFEVVVVDDGSADATPSRMEDYLAKTPLDIRFAAKKNSGPAAARNLGISMLESAICLLLGDDVFASSTLVERHLRFHREHPGFGFAALGLTKWSATGQTVSPFMTWLGENPIQFAYKDLSQGAKADYRHFYSSNLSVKTDLLKQFPFNEDFPFAAMEDAEVGYRIAKYIGLSLAFVPDAIAYHLHPTSFRQACDRMLKVGYSARLLHALWPQLRPQPSNPLRQRAMREIIRHAGLLKLLQVCSDLYTGLKCPNRLMTWTLDCFYQRGYESCMNGNGTLEWRNEANG